MSVRHLGVPAGIALADGTWLLGLAGLAPEGPQGLPSLLSAGRALAGTCSHCIVM